VFLEEDLPSDMEVEVCRYFNSQIKSLFGFPLLSLACSKAFIMHGVRK
jgi:hypothetical protein